MYQVSAQGIDERMINVHYYYYSLDGVSLISQAAGMQSSCQLAEPPTEQVGNQIIYTLPLNFLKARLPTDQTVRRLVDQKKDLATSNAIDKIVSDQSHLRTKHLGG